MYRIVQTIVELLQDNDIYVVYYNSRGVGKSTGWPSFTGKTEGGDLEALVQHFLEKHSHVNDVTFIVRRLQPCLYTLRLTEAIGIFPWFADSDTPSRIALANQDFLYATLVSSRTKDAVDYV
ncbi:hypothetical protein JVU11DRAFT_4193 [Chiua virens]|nr:hypothetical protein JVU11DRAFT_4193 [Chiua virens]